MAVREEIRSYAERLERLLDARDEATEDIKELKLEAKCKSIPMKAIEELIQARRKDKVGKKRDHLTDLLTIAPTLGIDLGILPESEIVDRETGEVLSEAAE